MKKIKALALAVLMAASVLTACGTDEAGTASGETVSLKNSTEIVLNGDTATCDNPSVYITEDRISITSHGTTYFPVPSTTVRSTLTAWTPVK